MPNRSIKDERAGAPGPGSLIGKRPPKPDPVPDPATKDLSVAGAADKIRGRRSRIDRAVDEASGE